MPILAGFVNPIGRAPAFLIPLFRESATSNHLLVQRIAAADTVASFEVFDDLNGFEPFEEPRPARVAMVGGAALWAFALGHGDVLVGTADEIRPDLELRLRRRELAGLPLLETEVAAFCGADDVRAYALAAAYEALGGPSALGARVWRDVVVLRPAVCADFVAMAKKARITFGVADLDAIMVESSETFAQVYVPLTLFQTLGQLTPDRLLKAGELAAVFGLEIVIHEIRRKRMPSHPVVPTASPLIYPTVSCTGPGLIGLRMPSSLRSGHQPRVFVGPFGRINNDAGKRFKHPWPEQFVAFRNSDKMLKEMSSPASLRFYDSQLIGILIQRAGFGSPKSSTIPIDRAIEKLIPNDRGLNPVGLLDIFYVGGHVLQRPLTWMPEMAAMDRGRALALSAASALMSLAYATGAGSLRQLLPRIRRVPMINLAIRSKVPRNETHIDTLRKLRSLLLHPEVPLSRGGEVFLVISPNLREVKHALIEDLVASTHIDARVIRTVELPRHGGQPQISLIATDVPFVPPTLSGFRQFCRDLLIALGWLVETRSSENALPSIVATIHGVTVLFTPLIDLSQANVAVRDALEKNGLVLLTTVSSQILRQAGSQGR